VLAMEAGPPGSPCRGRSQTTAKLHWSRAGVESVCGKGTLKACQVRAEKANESEPLLTCRKRTDGIETGVQLLPRDEPGGNLLTGQVMLGTKAARVRLRRWHGTWEPVAPARPGACWSSRRKEVPQAAETARGGVPVRGTGADRPVVARKPGNAGGAKGTGCPGSLGGQPAWLGGAW